jgi:site-specific recombinase XerD
MVILVKIDFREINIVSQRAWHRVMVMTACGIEKSISYHCRRHSFATLALSKGMPIESVSRVLGHTNIVTTQIYAKNTSQKLNADLTMLGDKLNASFKSIK